MVNCVCLMYSRLYQRQLNWYFLLLCTQQLKSKSKDWLVQNLDYVSGWNDIYLHLDCHFR